MDRKDLKKEIIIPEGITANIEENKIIMKKESNELQRRLEGKIDIKIEKDKIILESKKTTKNERKIFGTINAHINNMIKGLTEGFKYKLQIANVHFPMNVSHDKENNEIVIKNFLGEKQDRRVKLVEGVEVKVDKETIELESFDIEKAGQCAANIEKGAKVKNKDRRIFQDGIFIIEKPGRTFL
jgi:large subunit ribosomal protein L6